MDLKKFLLAILIPFLIHVQALFSEPSVTAGTWFAYVVTADGDDLVTPINTSNNTPGTPISVGTLPQATPSYCHNTKCNDSLCS